MRSTAAMVWSGDPLKNVRITCRRASSRTCFALLAGRYTYRSPSSQRPWPLCGEKEFHDLPLAAGEHIDSGLAPRQGLSTQVRVFPLICGLFRTIH